MRGDEKKSLQRTLAELIGVKLDVYYAKYDNGLTIKNLKNWIEWIRSARNGK